MQPARQRDVVDDVEVGDQIEELKDVAHVRSPERIAFMVRHVREVPVQDAECSLRHSQHARDQAEKSRLAAAARTEEKDVFPSGNLKCRNPEHLATQAI